MVGLCLSPVWCTRRMVIVRFKGFRYKGMQCARNEMWSLENLVVGRSFDSSSHVRVTHHSQLPTIETRSREKIPFLSFSTRLRRTSDSNSTFHYQHQVVRGSNILVIIAISLHVFFLIRYIVLEGDTLSYTQNDKGFVYFWLRSS